ncbi:energy-coupling factor transporter ATPase [Candidatus Poribacteria bacterium]|nr:energy-coupling factor transporter ATPase [Candidatus Poribacteria bacterium]
MLIQIENLNYKYKTASGEISALKNINLTINKGEFIALIGPNSSGKSTLAKLLNALYLPESGNLHVDGLDTLSSENLLPIRQKVGMVFQNPENQIVGSTVEEDIAFGLENLGLDLNLMKQRIEYALSIVHMQNLKKISPHELSGGQKQRLAIAGVLAMQPQIIVFDEPTSLLDPQSAWEIVNLLHKLHKEHNITVILITQNMEEILNVDRIIVLNEGTVFMQGAPANIFTPLNIELLFSLGLEPPAMVELSRQLIKQNFPLPYYFMNEEKLVAYLSNMKKI